MSSRNTFVRSLHDLGAAAWFGGSLMGAVGVNGAASTVRDPRDRARSAAMGWAKWAPVNAARDRRTSARRRFGPLCEPRSCQAQSGVTANTITKIALTATTLGAAVYSGVLGAKAAQGDGHSVEWASEPSAITPKDVAAAQNQLRYLQWDLPVLTVLGAQQGEQQRPGQILSGVGATLARRAS